MWRFSERGKIYSRGLLRIVCANYSLKGNMVESYDSDMIQGGIGGRIKKRIPFINSVRRQFVYSFSTPLSEQWPYGNAWEFLFRGMLFLNAASVCV